MKSRFLRKSILGLLVTALGLISCRGLTYLGLLPNLIPADENVIRVEKLVSAVEDARTAMREGYASSDSSAHSEDEGSEESDEDIPPKPSASVLYDITDDIRLDVECLLDLESLIKSPFVDPSKHKSVEQQCFSNALTPHQPYLERISRRFPGAGHDLVDRLAKANWHRFQRIQSDKQQNAALDEQGSQDRDSASQSALSERVSDFYDSGLGTSMGTRSSYADTIMSYRQNSDKSVSTRIPPLTVEAKNGEPFERHLFNDLRPWICHDASCQYGNEPFSSKEDWVQHLALQHDFQSDWRSVNCPLCLEPTGDGKVVILKHLANHFEEISLSSLPTWIDSDSESGDNTSHITPKISGKALQDVVDESDGNEKQVSVSGPEWQPDLNISPKLESGLIRQVYSKPEQSRTVSPSPQVLINCNGGEQPFPPGVFFRSSFIPEEAAAAEAAKKEAEALEKKIAEEARAKYENYKKNGKDKATIKGKDKAPIKFKDAVGRKFSFPFHLCSTWTGMEELIKQAFIHVDVIGPQVQEGHYDLIGPNGEIILPQVWDNVVEPDWAIEMRMWPMNKPPSRTGPPGGDHDAPAIVTIEHKSKPKKSKPQGSLLSWMAGAGGRAPKTKYVSKFD
ncbi:hypothetical protein CSPAE12_00332 [Colletotrichum incanum]|nr:hypothetical protein CSPAE12_00332 [Colletotrichum incanum]